MTDPSVAERRRVLAPGYAVGITDEMIEAQVRAFYAKVRVDPVLGPIFGRIHDWEPHLARMCSFWSSVMLMSGTYKGNPVAKHAPLELASDDFARWLSLFAQTAEEVCAPAAAALFTDKAQMIAQSLELAAAVRRGELPRSDKAAPGQQNRTFLS
jgi:hemoglobin